MASIFAGKIEAQTAPRRSSNTVLGAQRMKDHTQEDSTDKKGTLTNSNGTSVDPVQGQRAFAAMKKAGAAVNIKKK